MTHHPPTLDAMTILNLLLLSQMYYKLMKLPWNVHLMDFLSKLNYQSFLSLKI